MTFSVSPDPSHFQWHRKVSLNVESLSEVICVQSLSKFPQQHKGKRKSARQGSETLYWICKWVKIQICKGKYAKKSLHRMTGQSNSITMSPSESTVYPLQPPRCLEGSALTMPFGLPCPLPSAWTQPTGGTCWRDGVNEWGRGAWSPGSSLDRSLASKGHVPCFQLRLCWRLSLTSPAGTDLVFLAPLSRQGCSSFLLMSHTATFLFQCLSPCLNRVNNLFGKSC